MVVILCVLMCFFFFSSRRRHTRSKRDWSSDVCSSDLFMLYNYGAAILRAVGDTKRPLIYLIFAGMANAVLDLLLVIVVPLGVARSEERRVGKECRSRCGRDT